MEKFKRLKKELHDLHFENYRNIADYIFSKGLLANLGKPPMAAKAAATAYLFENHKKVIHDNDMILGSEFGMYSDQIPQELINNGAAMRDNFGRLTFQLNADHFTPDYAYVLSRGVDGLIEDVENSKKAHARDIDAEKRINFLEACRVTLVGLSNMIIGYADAAHEKGLADAEKTCRKVAHEAPETFREALQLIWLIHISFQYEGRYAMALGRLDQTLYPYYKHDIDNGLITPEQATELLASTFIKIYETKCFGIDTDVVNICIGGVDREGKTCVNELSYLILEAVKQCNISGPNLSARMTGDTPDSFWDKCLEVTGTGLGYPAFMNSDVCVEALSKIGYDIEDCRDYSMVGCIETFLSGKQPPWSDECFNSAKFIELALNNGKCMLTGEQLGPETGKAEDIDTMQKLLRVCEEQIRFGALKAVTLFNNCTDRFNNVMYSQPYLSCFCQECIQRGLDIRDGGTKYPSIHGMGAIGIATVSDSLAAIEQVVFEQKLLTLAQLRDILKADYKGHEDLRRKMLKAPKYGNNDERVDKYARWFVDVHYEAFKDHRTRDNGYFYIAIASNINNIPAGKRIAATADGRHSQEPVSDAASPMHGLDKNGLTSVFNSTCKPDYTKVACGTVLNVKVTPAMLNEPNKCAKFRDLVKLYFARGGQEVQINCVSRDTLVDAMEHPENYNDLVVRVSGFSAFYTHLSAAVQKDILERTEHE